MYMHYSRSTFTDANSDRGGSQTTHRRVNELRASLCDALLPNTVQ